MRNADLVGVAWNVGNGDQFRLRSRVMFQFDFYAEWWLAGQLDRYCFCGIIGIFMVRSAVAIGLARTDEARRWSGEDLLRDGDRAVTSRIVIVVVIRELREFVIV